MKRNIKKKKKKKSLWEWLLASESWIYRFYDEKVVICYPLCNNINMWKLLVILVVKKNLFLSCFSFGICCLKNQAEYHIFWQVQNNMQTSTNNMLCYLMILTFVSTFGTPGSPLEFWIKARYNLLTLSILSGLNVLLSWAFQGWSKKAFIKH